QLLGREPEAVRSPARRADPLRHVVRGREILPLADRARRHCPGSAVFPRNRGNPGEYENSPGLSQSYRLSTADPGAMGIPVPRRDRDAVVVRLESCSLERIRPSPGRLEPESSSDADGENTIVQTERARPVRHAW